MVDNVCEFHKEMEARVGDRVSKATLKWLTPMLALPVIGAVLAVYAFIVTADYRYGTANQATQNAHNISMLGERMVSIKSEIQVLQSNINTDLSEIKRDLKMLTHDLNKREVK